MWFYVIVNPRIYYCANSLFVFVSCVQSRVVESSRVGSAGCVVHVDVHGELVMLWVAAM